MSFVNKKENHASLNTKILVVDDSSLMREMIIDILDEHEEFQVVGESINGEQACEFLVLNEVDVVLLDIEMPIMDGIGFLKKSKFLTDAKIIVVSSITRLDSEKLLEVLKLGATDVVSKPTGALSLDLNESRGEDIISSIKNQIYKR